MNYRFFAFLILLTLNLSCERDDICAESTSTTPRLLIEFYDASNTENLKSVSRLTAYGEGLVVDDNGQPVKPEAASSATLTFNQNSTELALPLLIGNEDETVTSRFILERETNLRLDSDPNTDSNEDIIEVSYIPDFVYVSRACGYKSIFQNLDIDLESDGDNWILNIDIDVVESIVENESTVHVRIFH